MPPTATDRQRALAIAGRIARIGGVVELRAGGVKLDGAALDAVLEDAVARRRVEIEMEILAYEQGARASDGSVITNRKGVRVRDGAMAALARSGKNTPFMRDHDQGNSLAKGGEVIASRVERDASNPGHARVFQTVRLFEPTAVERAARGLIGAVSIGLNPTGPVNCTVCGTEVFANCYHLPLDVVEQDGAQRVVEWEFQDAELIETSEVPIPAVQNAGPLAIRAALAGIAEFGGANPLGACTPNVAVLPTKNKESKMPTPEEKIAADAAAAVAQAKADEDLAKAQAELAIASAETERHLKELAGYRETARQAEEDAFIANAKLTGRIAPIDEESWRAMFKADKERAADLMDKRPIGCSTPVGTARQTTAAAPRRKPKLEGSRFLSERQRRDVLRSGMTEEQYNAALAKYDEIHAAHSEVN